MITATGWSIAQVDDLPWPDLLDLLDYWKEWPPVHVLVRGFFGGDGKGEVIEEPTEEDLQQALRGLGL